MKRHLLVMSLFSFTVSFSLAKPISYTKPKIKDCLYDDISSSTQWKYKCKIRCIQDISNHGEFSSQHITNICAHVLAPNKQDLRKFKMWFYGMADYNGSYWYSLVKYGWLQNWEHQARTHRIHFTWKYLAITPEINLNRLLQIIQYIVIKLFLVLYFFK